MERYSAMLWDTAWRYGLSATEADELVQEVRIRLWRATREGDHAAEQIRGVPVSYVYRISTSAALDLIRRRRSRGGDRAVELIEAAASPSAGPAPDAALEAWELAEQVARTVDRIPPSRRPVVRLHLAGHSREEVAELMGWSEAKTRNLLYRGLADLRARLNEIGVRGEGGP